MQVIKRFRIKPRPKPTYKQTWFTLVPLERFISIRDLDPEQDYAFSKYMPNDGGFRSVVASGDALQRSWAKALKRCAKGEPNWLDTFMAAAFVRPQHRERYPEPVGWWREVRLFPKMHLYFQVQPIRRNRA